jgi:hypothetical protein
MRQWLDYDEIPDRVVDADPAPSPTYAQPTPADATSRPHAAQRGREVARVGLGILLLLVGTVVWLLLALPIGILGGILALAVSGAVIVGALYTLHSSIFWRW